MPEWKHKHLYKIEVNLSNLLILDSEQKIKVFVINFGMNKNKWFTEINWELVAKKYSGVEFNPYFYSLRLKPTMTWYNGIDVASGCVWNKNAIKKIVKLI